MKTPKVSGFLIQKYRKRKKLTQQQVANMFPTDVTRQAVQRWESGQDQPGPGRLKVLAELLDVEPYRLLDRDGQALYQGILEHIEDLFD